MKEDKGGREEGEGRSRRVGFGLKWVTWNYEGPTWKAGDIIRPNVQGSVSSRTRIHFSPFSQIHERRHHFLGGMPRRISVGRKDGSAQSERKSRKSGRRRWRALKFFPLVAPACLPACLPAFLAPSLSFRTRLNWIYTGKGSAEFVYRHLDRCRSKNGKKHIKQRI